MAINRNHPLLCAVFLLPATAFAQQNCPQGLRLAGSITDPTGAAIPSATVQAGAVVVTTDAAGRYILPCVPNTSVSISAQASGFATSTSQVHGRAGSSLRLNLQLAVAQVQTDVQVAADSSAVDANGNAAEHTLSSDEIQQLADDPDDFLRQIQILASSGAASDIMNIIVDGFQNLSVLPPKSSIASIRINPEIYAPEFQWPPWSASVVEIMTKPGLDRFHGAVFFTDSDGVFNATDPFSVTSTPAGKKRYGFELTGPLVSKKADFSTALEKRDIDEFNVVNAVTLDANGSETPFRQTVEASQRLWISSIRGDWQVSPRDTATLSFSARSNELGNQGVGGLTLPDAGYSSDASEYDLRFTNTQPINANLLHQTRIGFTWKRTEQVTISSAPALQVSGYFVGGGATSQNLNNRERDLEIDDDVIVTRGKHTWKAGIQSLGVFVHDYDPNTFNGAYTFGGGSAPVLDTNNQPTGQTTTISALQQYQRTLLGLPGGNPTTYMLTTGNPVVPFTQWQAALFGQDTVQLRQGVSVTAGLRYQLQTLPGNCTNFGPRMGVSWAPDKKATWVFHARAGIFSDPSTASYITEVYRLNGVRQHETTVYAPAYKDPLNPITGSIAINTLNQFQSTFHQKPAFSFSFQVEHDLPHHWHPWISLFEGGEWGRVRIRNIDAPLVASSVGVAPDPTTALLAPRPIAPNENIFQYGNGGHLSGTIVLAGMNQNSYKRFGVSATYKYENVKSDGGDNPSTPQSSYSNLGEGSRVDWNHWNSFTFSGHVVLPYKLDLATILDARNGARYNIITGTDNNGDGDFNDRPAYASAPGSGVYATRFGLLTTNTVNGDVPRNLGTMPDLIHLDTNLSRAFVLNPKNKEHVRTLTLNARSANLLNHTNVTAVNNVLSSGSLGQSLSAEAVRRIELGIRFSF